MLEVMVAVGVFGVVVTALMAYLSQAKQRDIEAEQRQDVELVRQYIRTNMDCDKTFANIKPADCGLPNRYVTALDHEGNMFADPSQTAGIGSHKVRVSCPVDDRSLFIEIQQRSVLLGAQAIVRWLDPFNGIPPFVQSARKTRLDFESVPGAAPGLVVDDAMNQYFRTTYGVSFASGAGGKLALARIAKPNSSKPGFEAWWSVKCPSKPNRNQLCFGGNGGQWILTTTSATDTKKISFDIIYDVPVDHLSFDLADVDGGENWTFEFFDAGEALVSKQNFTAKGYKGGTTGNSALTPVPLEVKAGGIRRVRATGTKNIKIFGFGFDNFDTGISACGGSE